MRPAGSAIAPCAAAWGSAANAATTTASLNANAHTADACASYFGGFMASSLYKRGLGEFGDDVSGWDADPWCVTPSWVFQQGWTAPHAQVFGAVGKREDCLGRNSKLSEPHHPLNTVNSPPRSGGQESGERRRRRALSDKDGFRGSLGNQIHIEVNNGFTPRPPGGRQDRAGPPARRSPSRGRTTSLP